jgi:hypothetical protein
VLELGIRNGCAKERNDLGQSKGLEKKRSFNRNHDVKDYEESQMWRGKQGRAGDGVIYRGGRLLRPCTRLEPILSRPLCALRHEAVGTGLCGASHSWPCRHHLAVIGRAAAVVEVCEPLLAAGALV